VFWSVTPSFPAPCSRAGCTMKGLGCPIKGPIESGPRATGRTEGPQCQPWKRDTLRQQPTRPTPGHVDSLAKADQWGYSHSLLPLHLPSWPWCPNQREREREDVAENRVK
jgi:hypothetical protein